MATTFSACPICMEDYDLETRVPKSLECRHVLCKLCLQNGADSLDNCPMCRQAVRDHQKLPNDFTMIDYLQRKQRKKDLKEQALLRSKLQEMSDNAGEEIEKIEKNIRANEIEPLLEFHAKQIFDRCIEECRHKTPVASHDRQNVESKLERLQHSVAVCMSLLDSTHISKDAVDTCETEVKEAVGMLRDQPGVSEKDVWHTYRQLLVDTFTELSQDPPSSDSSFGADEGNKPRHIGSSSAQPPVCTSASSKTSLFSMGQQLPDDHWNLRETARYKIQWGVWLIGLCYYSQRLFTVEERYGSFGLCMYRVTEDGLTLLDTVDLGVDTCTNPRVDGHIQQVYIPRGATDGVSVVSWDDNRLTPESKLTCVGECHSVAVMSPNTLCACDSDSGSVSVVSVTNDIVTATVQKPTEVDDEIPYRIAACGNTILVLYGFTLVVYDNALSSPGTRITAPAGLQLTDDISSDGVSRFLVSDWNNKAVFILDMSGKLCDRINIDSVDGIWDCTVGSGKLWVGCRNGDIIVSSLR